MAPSQDCFDICIIGGGLVGLTAALSLARAGFSIALAAPVEKVDDHRSTALLAQSVNILERLDIWREAKQYAFPLKTMRIIDGTNRLFRAPQTEFHAAEIGLPAFGYNIANAHLMGVLEKQVTANAAIKRFKGFAKSIDPKQVYAKIMLESKRKSKPVIIQARFVTGADGRNSTVRKAWSIGQRSWGYPQTGVVFNFKHTVSSEFTSTEFHTQTGPLTIVPHSNHQAGLVWVETPGRAKEIAAMSKSGLALAAENKMQSFLGKLKIVPPVQCFPLSGMIADRFGDKNCALAGEAAHVFPPIGAQGLNLGMRDVACLTQTLAGLADLSNTGEAYHHARYDDIHTRTRGVDLLNRSLLTEFVPLQLVRSTGLYALGRLPFLRRYVMQAGIAPAWANEPHTAER